MPFTGAGGQPLLPMSAPWINNAASTSSSDELIVGAATWPPSAASSSVTSHMDSSAAPPTTITEINLVSSPPTSHAPSPSRTRSSPLRPSLKANVVDSPSGSRRIGKAALVGPSNQQPGEFVASSDAEDGEHDGHADEPSTPERPRSRSPSRSGRESHASTDPRDDNGPTVYVEIPASSPSIVPPRDSTRSKRKANSPQSTRSRRRGSDASDVVEVDDDAAFAAQLAAQEERASRRPTRSARSKEVSYKPNCDSEGRPLKSKKSSADAATSSSSRSKAASKDAAASKKGTSKRRSIAVSDDEEDGANDGGMPGPSSSSNAKGATRGEGDADLTDEDVGFKARDRKKAKVTKAITVEDDDDDAAASDHDDGIMTPPQLTSPRRSSRKGAPSPKKQQLEETTKSKKGKGKGKGQPSKTFDLEGDIEDNEAEEVEAPTGRSSRKDAASRKPTRAGKAASPVAEESEAEKEEEAEEVKAEAEKGAVKEQLTELSPSSEPSASSSKPADTPATPSASSSVSAPARATPTTVAIKRIDPSTPSSRLSSPSTSGPSSFYGKSLTKILTSSAARRPGLTRKTNIPSLLNHRGAPKPPAPKLAVSKRRMQDDDYEYDAEYEALIAKKEKGSDDESDEEEKEDGGAEEVEVEEQYD